MKACWGPEFEPSVEDIVDYPMISLWRFSQFAFSSELAFRAGGFPYSVEHVACAVCQCVLVRIYGGLFMRDSGRSLQVVHYVTSRVPIRNKEFGSRYDEIMMK